jgi:hypothetical protein
MAIAPALGHVKVLVFVPDRERVMDQVEDTEDERER